MPLDINSLKKRHQVHWSDIWDADLNRFENTYNILNKIVVLPDPEIQTRMAAVYLWLNSNWSDQVPYLFSYGPAGSGKSLIATVAERMLDIEALTATSTARAVRNEVNSTRFPSGEDGEEADMFMLIWDNVNQDTFMDTDMLGVFLQGAIRGKDVWKIASKEAGVNVGFRTFSPKVFSSVWPIHCQPNLQELTRRCIVIQHNVLTDEEVSELDLMDLDSIDFSDFLELKMLPFYASEQRYYEYSDFRKAWKKLRRKGVINLARKSIYADLAATGYIIGAWSTPGEAFEVINGYEEYATKLKRGSITPLQQVLEAYAETVDGPIDGKELSAYLDLKHGSGKLLESPKKKELIDTMRLIGYSFVNGQWVC